MPIIRPKWRRIQRSTTADGVVRFKCALAPAARLPGRRPGSDGGRREPTADQRGAAGMMAAAVSHQPRFWPRDHTGDQ
jgi:hypothetical protein